MKIVILGSGTGSNAEAILKCWKEGKLGKAEPVAIFSDKSDARILSLGETFGVRAEYIDPGRFRTKMDEEAEMRYVNMIKEAGADLIVLAGFMRVLHDAFLNAFKDRIINLHPSLLPAFPGLHSIQQAFDHGAKYSGCTVHWVTAGLDMGPIIDQSSVRIEDNDTLETLETKVHAEEHKLLPKVISLLADKL